MSRNRLPVIGSSGSKTVPRQPGRRKQNHHHQQQQQQDGSSCHPHPAPPSTLLSDTIAPWGGLTHVDSSFTTIPPALPPPRPPPLPPSPPAVPQPTPTTPHGKQEDEESSSFSSEVPSPGPVVSQKKAGGIRRDLQMKRGMLPSRPVPRPPRLPPLRPITNLSFSRSFTFSFFELPLHYSPHCRAARVRNLLLLLKQIHY